MKQLPQDYFVLLRPIFKFFYNTIGKKHIKRKLNEYDFFSFSNFDFMVFPTVFHPVLFFSGIQFARFLLEVIPEIKPDKVLDLGTGSGINAIIASKFAKTVHAVDKNPSAVLCTTSNIALNRKQQSIFVFQGDLFEPVKDEKYDLILFNPPYYKGEPKNLGEIALYGGETLEIMSRFASEAKSKLNKNGCILLFLSTEGEALKILDIMGKNGYKCLLLQNKELFIEKFFLFQCY